MENSNAILTRLTKLTDTSLIVHWFTADAGRIKTVAKGALRPKSAFAGKLDLFFSADVQWSMARRGDLHSLREVSVSGCRENIRRHYPSTLMASYFCRLLELSVELEHPEPELHDLLHRGLDHIDAEGPSVRAVSYFESEVARMLGVGKEARKSAAALREALGGLPPQREQLLGLIRGNVKMSFPDPPAEA